MTELLYYQDAYMKEFEAKVLSCTPIEYNKKNAFDLVLDRTCFFPEQGGQDSDNGYIMTTGVYTAAGEEIIGRSNNILHVSIKDNVIHHIISEPFDEGQTVHGSIDWNTRYDRMQQHSGEHLFSGTVHAMFGYDNVGFHLSDREVTLDFNGVFTDDELSAVEDKINNAVYENFAVKIFVPTREELATIEYRSKKELLGDVRIVEFPGYDICACCAPHVSRTGEIGMIKIVAAEHFKGGTRIWIKCGHRALVEFRERLGDCRQISQITSTKIGEIVPAVTKLSDSLKTAKFTNISLQRKIIDSLVSEVSGTVNPCIFLEDADNDSIREAVNKLVASSKGYCSAFIGNDDKGYRFIIGAATDNCRDLITTLKSSFEIKGGGTPDMVQGTIIASRESILAAIQK